MMGLYKEYLDQQNEFREGLVEKARKQIEAEPLYKVDIKDEEVNDGWYPLYNYAMVGLITCLAIARGLFVKRRKCNCDEGSDDDSSPATYLF